MANIVISNVDKHSTDGEPPVTLCNYVDVYKNERITRDLSLMNATASLEQIERFSLLPGDVVITKDSETPDDIGVPALVTDAIPRLVCGYHLAVMRPKEGTLFGPYLLRLLQSDPARRYYSLFANGVTRFGLTQYAIRNLPVEIPSIDGQQKIADFLDRETAKADALVAKYERLIELLEEKRVALITQAVTKGLDPNVPMKDSRIEWIGEIPKGWEVVRLRFLCDVTTGGRDTVDAQGEGEYPFFVRSQTVERIDECAFDCEAVLTAGDGVGVGRVFHYYAGKFNAHQRVYVLSKFRRVVGKYLFYYLRSNFYRVTVQGTAKSTVDSIRMPMLKGFEVCIPSETEQQEIVHKCGDIDKEFSGIIESVRRAMDLTKEHRSALITAAVTGQIDVRTYRSRESRELEGAIA
ncbi:MAG: restriction endonuclease subunit S [Vulcanimicrobiaceae bacterium]